MARLEIPDLPENVYKEIVARARVHGVPAEQEAARILVNAIASDDEAEARLLAEIRAGREALGNLYVTEAELQEAKRWGRE